MSCKSEKEIINYSHGYEYLITGPDGYTDKISGNAVVKKDVKYGEVKGFYTSKIPEKKKNGKPAIIKEVLDIFSRIKKDPENIPLYMDIYQPYGHDQQKKPVLLFVHGGGFFFGDKNNELQKELTGNLIEQGCVVVSINHRLGSRIKGFEEIKMAIYCCVQDVRAALRYVTYYADELNIDPEKIYLAGSSSGGIIALTTAFMDEDEIFECCKNDYFQEHFGNLDHSGNRLECDYKLAGVISLWGAITDLNMIDERNYLPALLFHGTEDNILYNQSGIPFCDHLNNRMKKKFFRSEHLYGSLAIYEYMRKWNLPVKYVPFDGYNHAPHEEKNGTFNGNLEIVKQEMTNFIFSTGLTSF